MLLLATTLATAFTPSAHICPAFTPAPCVQPPPSMILNAITTRLNPSAAEQSLVGLVESGSRKRTILDAFEELEAGVPTPDNLLLTQRGTSLANGRWLLIGSIANKVGEDLDSGISNAINASGIVVDAATERKPVQEINVDTQRIANELYRPLPFGQNGIIRVAGGFAPRPEQASGKRAYVNFDSLEFFLETDSGAVKVLSLGWLFAFIKAVRPALTDGDADGPWLETTYLSQRVRLGRGNKGSIFVLQRSNDDRTGGPLADYPM